MNTIRSTESRWDRVVEALILSGIEVGEFWVGWVPLEVTEDGVLLFYHFDPYTRDYLLKGNWEGDLPDDWQSWSIEVYIELEPGKYRTRLQIEVTRGKISLSLLHVENVELFETTEEFE